MKGWSRLKSRHLWGIAIVIIASVVLMICWKGEKQTPLLIPTNMPSILVEQAFMSNPYDEARLLDPKYQEEQAEAIVKGLENYLNAVRE